MTPMMRNQTGDSNEVKCSRISTLNQTFCCHIAMLGSHIHQMVNSLWVDLPIACIWWLDLKLRNQNKSLTMIKANKQIKNEKIFVYI